MSKIKKDILSAIDVTKLEPVDNLDEEELEIHQHLRDGNFVAHFDQTTKKKYAKIFKAANRQRKALSLRMPSNDYIEIKARALALGMPYQTLINSLIHRYLTGELILAYK